ncbi:MULTISPECIES: hypothetical protein [unclassified Neisseria]|uniref:hypothetical protein n=1 Tax=unclassified Neisseria TaxID=2623750 RepID=UPI001D1601D8|nr:MULTISPECIES: hypothetical protein [unclassified Neisseria]
MCCAFLPFGVTARSPACLSDMFAPAALLRLELHPHLGAKVSYCDKDTSGRLKCFRRPLFDCLS